MLTRTTTVSQPPPVARCGNTRVVLDTNDDFGLGLPDVGSAAVVLRARIVGFGDAAVGLNQLPCCPNATVAKANTKPIDEVATLIDLIPHLSSRPKPLASLWRPFFLKHEQCQVFRGERYVGRCPCFQTLMRDSSRGSWYLELRKFLDHSDAGPERRRRRSSLRPFPRPPVPNMSAKVQVLLSPRASLLATSGP